MGLMLGLQYVSDLDASNRLKSVTQERDLDEFLSTAQLAGTEFTAGMHYRCIQGEDFAKSIL